MTRTNASRSLWALSALVLVGLLWATFYPVVSADPVATSSADARGIAVTVSELLKTEHLTRHPFDQEITQRCLTQFFKMLDPLKVYFYQSDVDRFVVRQKEVEKVEKGDTKLSYQIFETFLRRVDERVKLADQLLAMPHDFTVDEEVTTDRDAMQYAKNEAEARERWRKRVKLDLLVLRADRIDEEKQGKDKGKPATPPELKSPAEQAKADLEKLANRYHHIAKRWHQTNNDELLEMYLTALCSAFDPHTSYMSQETVDNFQIAMKLELEGIGAVLKSDYGETVIQELVSGGAADKEGHLKAGDRIVGVGQGDKGPIEDVVEMKLSDVVKKIRGPRGTVVRLEVLSPRSKERKIIQITREKIELKDREARAKVFEDGRRPDGKPYQIGVIQLPSFYMDMEGARQGLRNFKSTTRDVRRILENFNREGVDALVLDLRQNGGGSLQEAISLTGLFLGDGPIVQVKDSDNRVTPYNDAEGSMLWRGPMVVLVSKYSASASEILAGAIQDYGRGLIVGDHSTHGKGTVQSLTDLGGKLFGLYGRKLGSLKITMQQFYRPKGDSTQKQGVLADIELPSLSTHFEGISEADLDYAIPFERVPAQQFRPFNLVNKEIIDRLDQLSLERRGKSREFDQPLKRIARYEEQKKRKRITLNERKYLAERAEWNTEKEEEKKLEEMAEGRSAEIKRDYYLDEVLAITEDYLHLLARSGGQAPQAVQAAKAAPSEN